MRTILLTLIGISLFFFGCKKDENLPETEKLGDIYITAYTNDFPEFNGISKLLKNVAIFTVPTTKAGTTDEFGTFLIKDVNIGSYEVYASLNGFGAGKTIIKVEANIINNSFVHLLCGTTLGIEPKIELIQPILPANFSLNEKVIFSFKITDDDTLAENINVVISSNIDGKLFESHPDLSNLILFETTSLSSGVHDITVTATDKDNYKSTINFSVSTIVPENIILENAIASNGVVRINWLKYTFSDFASYEILRTSDPSQEGQLLESFFNSDSLCFIDKSPPIVSEIYYYVRIKNKHDQFRNSNFIKVVSPFGQIYYYSSADAVHHPTEPVLFIFDKSATKIRAINYETNAVVSSSTIPGVIGKIDIGDNGKGLEIYVPSSNGNIYVFEANSLNLNTTILTGLPTSCVITNGNGYVAASVTPSPWWEQPIRTYSRNNGMYIGGNTGSSVFEGSYMRFIPKSDKIISISRGVSPVDMDFFELSSTGNFLAQYNDSYHGDYLLDPQIFRISSDGEYVVTGKKGVVYAASSTMLYKGTINGGALDFSDYTFSDDGKTIYAGTSNRTSIQIVKYPELTREKEILTKGNPIFLFNYKGEIVSISTSPNITNAFVIERIKL